jgi:cytochrome oxidase Cu insertion factor (SCO1/SenC/PrrC family)
MSRFIHARRAAVLLSLVALSAGGCFTPLAWPKAAALTSEGPPPDFTLPDQDGRLHNLAAMLAEGPLVLVFYRGYW